MPTTTSVHSAILAALQSAGVHAVLGPAEDLPAGSDGRVGQAAVLWPQARFHTYTRATGTRSGGSDRVIVTCVGATSFDALAVADKVDTAIGGMRVSDKGGTLAQTIATTPVAEPNADPVRVSLAVEYSVVTKG